MDSNISLVFETIGEIKRSLQCSICLELLNDPHSTKCNHQFCSQCIRKVIDERRNKKEEALCPLCKNPVTKRSLTSNPRLKEIVDVVRRLNNTFKEDAGLPDSPYPVVNSRSGIESNKKYSEFVAAHPTPQKPSKNGNRFHGNVSCPQNENARLDNTDTPKGIRNTNSVQCDADLDAAPLDVNGEVTNAVKPNASLQVEISAKADGCVVGNDENSPSQDKPTSKTPLTAKTRTSQEIVTKRNSKYHNSSSHNGSSLSTCNSISLLNSLTLSETENDVVSKPCSTPIDEELLEHDEEVGIATENVDMHAESSEEFPRIEDFRAHIEEEMEEVDQMEASDEFIPGSVESDSSGYTSDGVCLPRLEKFLIPNNVSQPGVEIDDKNIYPDNEQYGNINTTFERNSNLSPKDATKPEPQEKTGKDYISQNSEPLFTSPSCQLRTSQSTKRKYEEENDKERNVKCRRFDDEGPSVFENEDPAVITKLENNKTLNNRDGNLVENPPLEYISQFEEDAVYEKTGSGNRVVGGNEKYNGHVSRIRQCENDIEDEVVPPTPPVDMELIVCDRDSVTIPAPTSDINMVQRNHHSQKGRKNDEEMFLSDCEDEARYDAPPNVSTTAQEDGNCDNDNIGLLRKFAPSTSDHKESENETDDDASDCRTIETTSVSSLNDGECTDMEISSQRVRYLHQVLADTGGEIEKLTADLRTLRDSEQNIDYDENTSEQDENEVPQKNPQTERRRSISVSPPPSPVSSSVILTELPPAIKDMQKMLAQDCDSDDEDILPSQLRTKMEQFDRNGKLNKKEPMKTSIIEGERPSLPNKSAQDARVIPRKDELQCTIENKRSVDSENTSIINRDPSKAQHNCISKTETALKDDISDYLFGDIEDNEETEKRHLPPTAVIDVEESLKKPSLLSKHDSTPGRNNTYTSPNNPRSGFGSIVNTRNITPKHDTVVSSRYPSSDFRKSYEKSPFSSNEIPPALKNTPVQSRINDFISPNVGNSKVAGKKSRSVKRPLSPYNDSKSSNVSENPENKKQSTPNRVLVERSINSGIMNDNVDHGEKGTTGDVLSSCKQVSLVVTRLPKQFISLASYLAKRIGGEVTADLTSETTHVIMPTDSKMFTSRKNYTIKYLLGIALGKWIVSQLWLTACIKAGTLVDEKQYEVKGDPDAAQTHVPNLARTTRQSEGPVLFSGVNIICFGNFKGAISKVHITKLVQFSSGQLVYSKKEAVEKNVSDVVVIVDSVVSKEEEVLVKEFCQSYNTFPVSAEWVTDSVANYQLQDIEEYRMECY